MCLQVTRPKAVLILLTCKEMAGAITLGPLYQGLPSQPKFRESLNVAKFLDTTQDKANAGSSTPTKDTAAKRRAKKAKGS